MANSSEVFRRGYEKWDGPRTVSTPPWLLIGISGLRNVISSAGCLGRLAFIIMLSVYFFGVVVLTAGRHQLDAFAQSEFLSFIATMAETYVDVSEARYQFEVISRFAIFFSTVALLFFGCQLIARDRGVNALQVYFSKAVSRTDYVMGKFLTVGILTAVVTLLPSALMLLMGLALNNETLEFIKGAWSIPLYSGAFWLILTLSLGSFSLYFSSCFKKSYMASVAFLGFLLFTQTVAAMIMMFTGFNDFLGGFYWFTSVFRIGQAIFLHDVSSVSALLWRLIDLGLVSALFLTLLYRNVRPVEVVK